METLITYNLIDYEERAVALASDTEEMNRLRVHLETVRLSGVLFDTPRFVRELEEKLLPLAR
jgi:predicted O-linked N-acetylglucosamine transferase (SPINDLY family)